MVEQISVIILPEDAEHTELLRRKLKEYAQRFKRDRRAILDEGEYSPPNKKRLIHLNSDSAYKLRVLSELLHKGIVETSGLSLRIARRNEKFLPGYKTEGDNFNNACTCVELYCRDIEFLRGNLK